MTTQNSSNNESSGMWINYISTIAGSVGSLPLYEHTAVSVGTNIYVMGGRTTGGTIQSINYQYNALVDAWATKTAITAAKAQHCSATDGTNVFAISGVNSGTTPINTVYRYNVSTNDYTTMNAITTAVRYASAVYVASQGLIYVTGGITDTGTTRSKLCQAYTPGGSWVGKSDLPQTLYGHASCDSPDGLSFYVFGGYDTASRTTVYKYTIATDSWSSMTSMPVALSYINAVRIGNYVYILQGNTTAASIVSLVYDINNNSWDFIKDSSNALYSNALANVNGSYGTYIYNLGGWDGTTASNLTSVYKV